MKLPELFKPKENLDREVQRIISEFKIKDLLKFEILRFRNEVSYNSDRRLGTYKFIKSAITYTGVTYRYKYDQRYDSKLDRAIEITLLAFDKQAKFYLKDVADEFTKGVYRWYKKSIRCLIKEELAVIIKPPFLTLDDLTEADLAEHIFKYDGERVFVDHERKDLEYFVNHYKKLGFI